MTDDYFKTGTKYSFNEPLKCLLRILRTNNGFDMVMDNIMYERLDKGG